MLGLLWDTQNDKLTYKVTDKMLLFLRNGQNEDAPSLEQIIRSYGVHEPVFHYSEIFVSKDLDMRFGMGW